MPLIAEQRLLQLSTPEGDGLLLPISFHAVEALSEEFAWVLECVSDTSDLNPEDWQGKAVTLAMQSAAEDVRYFNGVIQELRPLGQTLQSYVRYAISVAPEFAALAYHQDCRVFQRLSVIDIVKTVCQELQGGAVDSSSLGKQYPQLLYVVQYNEITLHFLKRLLAEHGIYYIYAQNQNGHVLTLLDSGSANPQEITPVEYQPKQQTRASCFRWRSGTDSDINTYEGASTVSALAPNGIFDFSAGSLPGQSGRYRVTRLEHYAYDHSLVVDSDDNTSQQIYSNSFTALPKAVVVSPTLLTKPLQQGLQSANVTSMQDRALYTNNHGGVRAQFPWDRQNRDDESSSRWLPAMQLHADNHLSKRTGNANGTQFIPREDDEVWVDFLQADIDQPTIIGGAYHAVNSPIFPADIPHHGFKTQLLNGKERTPGHELSFLDAPSQEQLTLHSQGQLQINTFNTLQQTTVGDDSRTVGSAYTLDVPQGLRALNAASLQIIAGTSELAIDAAGVRFNPAGKLLMKALGVGGTFIASHLGDKSKCPRSVNENPDHGGLMYQGSGSTHINQFGSVVSRVGDPLSCDNSDDIITQGATSILTDGQPTAYIGSQTQHGGVIKERPAGGPMNVLISDRGLLSNEAIKQYTIASHLKPCSDTPTPAPEDILGTCQYYRFRYDDFVKRHVGCIEPHNPPDYYLNYGLKYCMRFSSVLYPKMSPQGKVWLIKARLLLQQYLEKGLQAAAGRMSIEYTKGPNPIANELNDQEFTDFVFNSHVAAYENAGFATLTAEDVGRLISTIDIIDDLNPDTYYVAKKVLGTWISVNRAQLDKKMQARVRDLVCEKVTNRQRTCHPVH